MKRMLINAAQPEERRLAIVDGQKLIDLEIEHEGREQRKGNIYKGVISRIEASLEACFVNIGEERDGFLPLKEISRLYFAAGVPHTAKINELVREGQEIVVQIEKEERGKKGAALTTYISLAGRYLVLMPCNPRGGGVSRRIDGEERRELRETLEELQYPEGMSLIARTAGIGREGAELQWDLDYLLKLWHAIEGAAEGAAEGHHGFLIYRESSMVIRAIRDYFDAETSEILIDDADTYEQAAQFMNHIMPERAQCVKHYTQEAPLFARYQIEHQIESAHARSVTLPSGGVIVIDTTEALVAVDVNSARATKGGDIGETALSTNLEAAEEIARQLRLRDLGGLVVIDFIDMEESKDRRQVEDRLRDSLRFDRARVQMTSVSKFGLIELSRQRLRPALSEAAQLPCPRCNGTGQIRGVEGTALQILRIIQEEAMKEGTAALYVQAPVAAASFLLNEKKVDLARIGIQQRVSVLLIPNAALQTPNYQIERLKTDDPRLTQPQRPSYKMAEDAVRQIQGEEQTQQTPPPRGSQQQPVISGMLPDTAAPRPASAPVRTGGVLAWLKAFFGRKTGAAPQKPAPAHAPHAGPARHDARRNDRRNDSRGPNPRNARDPRRNDRPGERPSEQRSTQRNGAGSAPERGERNGERGERSERSEARPASGTAREIFVPQHGGEDARPQPMNGERMNGERNTRTESPRSEEGEEGRSERPARTRHSRDRYGRDRRQARRNNGEAGAAPAPAPQEFQAQDGNASSPWLPQQPEPVAVPQSPSPPSFVSQAAPVPELTPAPAPRAEPMPAPKPAPTPMPSAPMPSAPMQNWSLPAEALANQARESGLEWVQSDAGRITAPANTESEPQPIAVRRPKPANTEPAEPLVLVETQSEPTWPAPNPS